MARNKYPEETVQKILDASLKLFLEKGFEQTTVLDIVDNLGGMTRGAFYHHFKSKEEVLDALSDKLFYDADPFQEVKNDQSLNGLEKIKKLIKLNFANTQLQSVNMASIPLLKNPRFLTEFLENNTTVVLPMIEELIQIGIEDGSIKTTTPKAMADAFMLITIWIVPSIFPCTKSELVDRIDMAGQLLDSIGLPVLDDEILIYLKELMNQIDFE